VIRGIEVGAGKTVEIVPARQQSEGTILKRTLQTRNVVLDGGRICVRPSFLNSVNHTVDTDSVIEDTRSAANHETAVSDGLPCETNPRSEVAERNPVFRCKPPVELAHAIGNRAMAALSDRPRVVIVGYYVSGESSRVGEVLETRRYRNRSQIARPEVR